MVPKILGPASRVPPAASAVRAFFSSRSFFSSRRVVILCSTTALASLSLLNSLVSNSAASASMRTFRRLSPSISTSCFLRNSTAVLTDTLSSFANLLIFVRISCVWFCNYIRPPCGAGTASTAPRVGAQSSNSARSTFMTCSSVLSSRSACSSVSRGALRTALAVPSPRFFSASITQSSISSRNSSR